MRIVTVHNFYQNPGGEDRVFSAETELLKSRGHDVTTFTRHNDVLEKMSSLEAASRTLWNSDAHAGLRDVVRKHAADIVHFHNTLPLISPAGYYAARAAGAAVVQTLHNFRLICPGSLLYRAGKPCDKCVTKRLKWPSVSYGCYRGSRGASGAVTAMLALHRAAGTYTSSVDAYITLSSSAKDLFVRGGLPAERVFEKPNFLISDPGRGDGKGGYALFAGRLTPEKGIDLLLKAWGELDSPTPLKVVGDGPLASEVQTAADKDDRIEWLGHVASDMVIELMREASFVVFPSTWYEGMPMTVIEALACGTPVVASNLGAMAEMVTEGETGFQFVSGSARDLTAAIHRAVGAAGRAATLRNNARRSYEEHYTAETNYDLLLSIYEAAVKRANAADVN